jgi:hypothetical protein
LNDLKKISEVVNLANDESKEIEVPIKFLEELQLMMGSFSNMGIILLSSVYQFLETNTVPEKPIDIEEKFAELLQSLAVIKERLAIQFQD